ncbi:MAG TPA: Uma2 family endonuclease [Gemmatimonadaceae bacterium]
MADPVGAPVMSMTVEEFLATNLPDGKWELVRGEPRVTPPPGASHGGTVMNLALLLGPFVKERRLGRVFADNVGYELVRLPRTVRVPDLSYVRHDRLPTDGLRPGVFTFAPDLVVEVLSPSEGASELQEKVDDYHLSGTRLIWVVDPARRTVTILADDAPARSLHEGDTLDGGRIVPGFTCLVSELFEGIARD